MTLADRRDALQIIGLGGWAAMALAVFLAHSAGRPPINAAVVGVAVLSIACLIGWKKIDRFLREWAGEWRRRRRIARRYRIVRHHMSITCNCGCLARPICGTRDRYRCGNCGQQWATSRHELRPLREYLLHADTPWPM